MTSLLDLRHREKLYKGRRRNDVFFRASAGARTRCRTLTPPFAADRFFGGSAPEWCESCSAGTCTPTDKMLSQPLWREADIHRVKKEAPNHLEIKCFKSTKRILEIRDQWWKPCIVKRVFYLRGARVKIKISEALFLNGLHSTFWGTRVI